MCNLSYIGSRTSEPLSDRAVNCLEVMSYMSSQTNKDGSGMMFRTRNGDVFLGHSDDKIRIKRGLDYQAIATHQRLSTSGRNSENLHPYKRDGFLLMHNGVFAGLGTKKESDSSQYCDKLQAELAKSGDMVAAIQAVHLEVSGSYSVLVYDRAKKRFIYYKNSSTSMTMIRHPRYLLMSTDSNNIKFALWYMQLDQGQCQEMKIEPNTIYDLATLTELGTIKEKAYSYLSTESGYGNKSDKYDGYWSYEYDNKEQRWDKVYRKYTVPNEEPVKGEVRKPNDEYWGDD
jgi:glucosamine 6-phosphate synthetase-like amidotransferase/phosphosugar isomerase protein